MMTQVINRNINETVNDSNDKAIVETALFFKKVLGEKGRVIFITNDRLNLVYFYRLCY